MTRRSSTAGVARATSSTIAQLEPLLPTGPRDPGTFLRSDLGMDAEAIRTLSLEIERGFAIALADSAVAAWRTLGDVAATIDSARALEAA